MRAAPHKIAQLLLALQLIENNIGNFKFCCNAIQSGCGEMNCSVSNKYAAASISAGMVNTSGLIQRLCCRDMFKGLKVHGVLME